MDATLTQRQGTHNEHVFLFEELDQIERDLTRLQCYSEVYADLASAQKLEQNSRRLAEWLPNHFRREEKAVFEKAARISPELEEFCRQMRGEHAGLLVRLGRLRTAIQALQDGECLYETISRVKEEGREFATRMRNHVDLEEEEFSGFL